MILVIVGPTGVGKTKMSIALAHRFNGEIINADSTQIYKGMNIATAKVTDAEKEGIVHHLIDIKEINENYTVYDYQKDSRKIIEDIKLRNKTPIIVGGTGLYIKASLYNYNFLLDTFNNKYDEIATNCLYKQLCAVDPKTDIHPNNRKRIIRALNYYDEHKLPMSEKEKSDKLLYDAMFIGLTTERNQLYDRINKRVDQMVTDGLIKEAEKIYNSNVRSKAVLTPIGYKELFLYFDKLLSLDESLELIKQRSRKYAKRQYTWFNNQMNVNWFDVDFSDFNKTIEKVCNFINSK